MRLWHISLIPKLPSKKDYKGAPNQLGGQHTEIRMILGSIKKHGRVNHKTVNYVNNYSLDRLYAYGLVVIDEMKKRGFNINPNIEESYKTKYALTIYDNYKNNNGGVYQEHDDSYLEECLENLRNKNIIINM
jgi:uncharacterized protein (TIGR02328 family)